MNHNLIKEIKPITDLLGLAVLDSQRLEYSLAFMMLLVQRDITFFDSEFNHAIDEYMENLSKKTLGNLIRQLEKLIDISPGFSDRLMEALEARNYLVHGLLNDVGEQLLKAESRKIVLQKIKSKRKVLYDTTVFLDPFIQVLMQQRGMDPKKVIDKVASEFEPTGKST